ncbi:MAG: uracil-DNA glycosylase [Aliidongia sp.]
MDGTSVLENLLEWYLAAGADEAIGDLPNDRFAEEALRGRPTRPAPVSSPAAITPMLESDGPPAAVAQARASAAAATTLDELRAAISAFDGCALRRTAINTVFADGIAQSRIMFIGEAPGADEDRIGRPFVGASGQLLDRMLATIGLDRTRNAYITNVLFWRPPGNRKPTEAEIAICRPFVERHIALVDPLFIVLVGGTASAALLPGSAGITKARGHWAAVTIDGLPRPVQAIPMYHPSFLLRSPDRKRESWIDLLTIRLKLKEIEI